jgi:hypothetical protein
MGVEDGMVGAIGAARVRAGDVVEIVGRLTSGRTSWLVRALADATRGGAAVALVDVDGTFDPASAARAGVDLARVLWVRADRRRDRALAALELLARCPGFGVVVLDAGEVPPRLPLTTAFRLKRALAGSGGVLVVVGRTRIMGAAADLAMETVQEGCEWTGAGTRARRLGAVRTCLQLVRPQAATHPRAAGGHWPRRARWIA